MSFDRVCWASIGQTPDAAVLQQSLYKQLVARPLSAAAQTDEQIALSELKEAAKDMSVLLMLDDVWDTSSLGPLNFIDDSAATSAVVVTTRIRSLISGEASGDTW